MESLPAKLHEDASVRVYTWRNLLLTVWTGPVEYTSVRATYDHGAALAKKYSGKVAYLGAVTGQMPMPGQTARLETAKLWKKSEAHMSCGAIVITTDGFWAGAARAALSGIMMVASTRYPNKVFARPEPAVSFLAPHVDGHPLPSELLRVYQEAIR